MDDLSFRMMELKTKGFCCSQIIAILGLEATRKTNVGLVRAVGGLCFGLINGKETCGALTGAACILAFYAGKGTIDEKEDERLRPMVAELHHWFNEAREAEGSSNRCGDILDIHSGQSACGQIVASTFAKTMEILENYEVDLYRE
jgi:hypothetical protein